MNKNYSMMMLFVVGFFCVVSDINSAPNKARTTRVEALQYKRFGLTPKAKARLRGSRRSKEFSQTVQALQKRQKKTILQSSLGFIQARAKQKEKLVQCQNNRILRGWTKTSVDGRRGLELQRKFDKINENKLK
jgi:hypothetical protein